VCIEESEEDKAKEHHFMAAQTMQKDTREENVCRARKTIIHKSVVDSATSHRGANDGKSIVKVDGNGAV
jgi:hypothetical protein